MRAVGPARAGVPAALVTAALATAVADPVCENLLARVPGWRRFNFRDRPVSLSGGAAAVAGSGFAAVLGAPPGRRAGLAGLLALSAAAGAYDDLVAPRLERRDDKGWRGHLRALRSGRPSGGVVKVAAVGAGAVVAARAPGRSPADVLARAALIAGSANLVNLLDLRPGRAGKTVLAAGVVGTLTRGPARTLAAAATGASAASLPADLAERRVLGDLGANVLGGLLGVRLAEARPAVRAAAGLAVAVATVASERVSFSAVIERTPLLRRLDGLGRRP